MTFCKLELGTDSSVSHWRWRPGTEESWKAMRFCRLLVPRWRRLMWVVAVLPAAPAPTKRQPIMAPKKFNLKKSNEQTNQRTEMVPAHLTWCCGRLHLLLLLGMRWHLLNQFQPHQQYVIRSHYGDWWTVCSSRLRKAEQDRINHKVTTAHTNTCLLNRWIMY